jgi:RNA polymerase sigma-70 factor (ECF subfamily)
MSAKDSFAALMERLRSGDDEAAREVFRRFARQLVALARQRIHQQLAPKVDAEDVVQSAYKSFFVRLREGGLRASSWDNLWYLLTLITLRKCADRVAHFQTRRRNVGREAPNAAAEPWREAVSREPRPEEAVVLAETVEELFRLLDEAERPVLELSLQGYSSAEIAERLGRAQRSVRRLREQIRKRLERLQEAT